ncbi:MAG: sugar phosphate isomerase/epimerase family protein [Akkermansiaceae bacterium]
MKIGINMHLWSNHVTSEHFSDIEMIKEVGYDGIEIFLAEQDTKNYGEVGDFLKSIDMEVNGCLGVGVEADPISTDAAVRRNAVDTIKTAIDNMHVAGGKNICGPFHSAFANFSRNSPQEDEYKRSAEVLRECAEHAAEAGIMLTPEALNRFECYLCNTMAQLKCLVDLVDHPNLKGMFDPHHANIEEKSYADAIRTIAPVMTHVHISENDRGAPGTGNVAWDEVFSTIAEVGYDGWYYIEAFSRDNVDFANAINVWRDYDPRMEIVQKGYTFTREMIAKYA